VQCFNSERNQLHGAPPKMRPMTLGLLGAAALTAGLTAGLLLVRQPRAPETISPRTKSTPAGERAPGPISLDRIRAQGY